VNNISPRRAGQARDGRHPPPGDYHTYTAGDEAPDHRANSAPKCASHPPYAGS